MVIIPERERDRKYIKAVTAENFLNQGREIDLPIYEEPK